MDPNYQKQPLVSSMFYMWRALLAFAWTDGSCGAEETIYFGKVFDNLARYFALTQEQRDALADDLLNAKKVETFMAYINDPEAQATLAYFARELAIIDGVIDPQEETLLKKLDEWGVHYDRAALHKEIQTFVGEKRVERAREKDALRAQIRGMSALYNTIDRLLMKLGIDVID